MATKITLYHDLSSTFTYPATHLLASPLFSRVPLRIVPLFLGGLFSATQNRSPITVPLKMHYLGPDFFRKCHRLGVPVRPSLPSKFPFNSIHAQRACVATGLLYGDEELKKLVVEMGEGFWGRAEWDPEDAESLAGFVKKVIGEEKGNNVLKIMKSDEVKKKLKENMEEAVQEGAFGAPWIVVERDGEKEVFWGVDSLEMVAEVCGVSWPPVVEGKKRGEWSKLSKL